MRVLHVVPSFYPAHGYGGPIASLYQLARAQAEAGLELRVLTSDADGAGGRLPRLAGRWVEDFGLPTWYAPVLRAQDAQAPNVVMDGPRRLKAIEDLAPGLVTQLPRWLRWAEVVHVTALFSPTSLLAASAAVAARRPLVLSPRGSLLPWALSQGAAKKRAALRALGPMLRRVNGWHATSQEEADTLPFVHHGRVRVVENGVALPALPPDDEEGDPFDLRGAGPVLTLLGRVDPVKGLDLAIAAFAALRRLHPRALLVLAGPDRDGYGQELRRLALALGVADGLRLPGLVVDARKHALLRRSDQLWLCSRMESFGNVVLEALAVGTPVVAVHSTPWRWLADRDLGAHCPAAAAAIADAAAQLLLRHGSATARAAFTTRARAAVAERFAWPAIAARMRAFYDEVRG